MYDFGDVILWCFLQNYYLDKSNACIHCGPVKFSPTTFRLFDALMALWPEPEDISHEMEEVKSHKGQYDLDHGR